MERVMSKETGGPAFARPFSKNGEYSDSQQNRSQEGMSLRDYFAAKVMASWIIAAPRLGGESADHRSTLAEQSYAMADAMLAARSA